MESILEAASESSSKLFDQARQIYQDSFNDLSLAKYMDLNRVTTLSDSELERSLTEIPQILYSVGERISSFALKKDIEKRQIKSLEAELKSSNLDSESADKIRSAIKVMQHSVDIYTYVISRATSAVTTAKEYLMGVKKIWDRRREVERSVPIAEKDYTLPEYNFSGKKYITGQDDLK